MVCVCVCMCVCVCVCVCTCVRVYILYNIINHQHCRTFLCLIWKDIVYVCIGQFCAGCVTKLCFQTFIKNFHMAANLCVHYIGRYVCN